MIALLLVLVLAAPDGAIRVRVEGPATEVVAFRDGRAVKTVPVRDGRALLAGLVDAGYTLRAQGGGTASDLVERVRPVADGAPGDDAVLRARPAFPVRIETEPGAWVWTGGVRLELDGLRLPAGFHRIVVDHDRRVSSAERLIRVAGPLTLAIPLERGLLVTGTVTADGRPVAGAIVRAFADGAPARRTATTNADGGFGVGGVRGHVVSLEVAAAGHATRLVRATFYPGEERTHVDVELTAEAEVALVFEDAAARAAATATLLPAWYEAVLAEPRLRANHLPRSRTAAAGLSFDGLAPGRRYRFLVAAPGRRPVFSESFVAGAVRRVHAPVLAAAAALHGAVDGGVGETVVCESAAGRWVCRADRAGRYRFDDLDPGDYSVWVEGVDERGRSVTLEPGRIARRDFERPAPDPERRLTGIVWDADRKPLAGVRVDVAGRRATTDAKGAFAIDALPPGPGRFVVRFAPDARSRAFVEDPHLPHVERKANAGSDLRVKLQRAGRMWVELDPGDRPLTRARLHVASGSSSVRLQRGLPRGARRLVIDELPLGTYVVEVEAPGVLGTAGAVVAVVSAPAAPTRIAVVAGRSARGRVLLRTRQHAGESAQNVRDKPAARGTVTLLDGDALRARATTIVEPDGSFLLDGLPPGPVLLAAAVPGLPVSVQRVDLTRADAGAVRFLIEPATEAAIQIETVAARRTARVRVVMEVGVDIRDALAHGRFQRVVASDEDAADAMLALAWQRNEKGRVAVPFLQPGSYRFHVSADRYKPTKVGVRARSPVAEAMLRSLPDVPDDWATPVRLVPDLDD